MRTKDDLRMLQALPLWLKIKLTQTRIAEWVNHFGEDGVFISVSGKDSSVLRSIAQTMYPNIKCVFCNTGLEFPELQSFWKNKKNVEIIRPKMLFRDVVSIYGYPAIGKEVATAVYYARRGSTWAINNLNGQNKDGSDSQWKKGMYNKYLPLIDADFCIGSRCCTFIKERPLDDYGKTTGRVPMIGTTTEESFRREQAWLKTGCNAFDADKQVSKPISFWTEQDILQYIYENNVEIPSIYGKVVFDGKTYKTTGRKRTGCMFCMFGAHHSDDDRFVQLKNDHPNQYKYCMDGGDYDENGCWKPNDKGLGMMHVIQELHRLYGKDFIKLEEEQTKDE